MGTAKEAGAAVELITNGTLLTPKLSHDLIAAGLDRLWVSLDGARPESYADVRLGAALPRVLENLRRFDRLRRGNPRVKLGIAYVAMRRNIADLPDLLALARGLGASDFHISHVLPYTAPLVGEALYSAPAVAETQEEGPILHLPRPADPTLLAGVSGHGGIRVTGIALDEGRDRCPFIERGSTSIAWDGGLSPCLELLHSHTSYLNGAERTTNRYMIGNVRDRPLPELWNDPEYVAFRERVARFTFAPCARCGSCPLAQENGEDCYGNPAPSCGGCLWAQGLIRCP